jgi:mRNA interferase MazF
VTVCAFTTDPTDAPLIRPLVQADEVTGIRESSRLMVDLITTIPRSKLGERIGQLTDDDMIRLLRALVVFLGLAGS